MNLNVGDKVLIVNERTYTMDRRGNMDKYLGRVMTIDDIDGRRYYMIEDSGWWCWYDHDIQGKPLKLDILFSSIKT